MEEIKFIDVDKIITDRAPKLKRWLPGFIFSWLRKKLHEEDINFIMNRIKDHYGLEYNARALELLGVKIETINEHLVPSTGGVIIAANHPLGGLDGMSLVKAVGDIRKDTKFVVNDILKNLKNYGDVFIGVNKISTTSAKSLRIMESHLLANDAVIFFPSGLVSRKIDGKIMDLPWRKGFVTQAIDHKRDIVPVYIQGENSRFFYRFANLRINLGIKANFEMLFLPDEMFRQKGNTVKIHFGKPFSYKLLDERYNHKKWADLIKQYVYSDQFMKGIEFEEFISKIGN
ncbi:MAG: 1-acyl-sn-glycerol-3-phosphate acyltransferase [Bacteroidota bacterium]|jgi:putative hemolysin